MDALREFYSPAGIRLHGCAIPFLVWSVPVCCTCLLYTSQDTVIDTVAKNARSTELKVDQNGDGKYDIKYRAKENGTGEVVDYTYLYYIVGGAVAFILFAVVVIAVKRGAKTRKS